eukprot:1149498-Pelagomonas_calceolata.AAC.9
MNCSSNKAQTNIVGLQAEGDIQANRSDFQVMQDRQNLFHKGLMVMERQIKEQEMAVEVQNGRLLKIENDTRVPDLEKVSQDYLNFKSQVGHFISKSDKLFEGLDDRMGKLDHKVEQGPPGLWKLTAQISAVSWDLVWVVPAARHPLTVSLSYSKSSYDAAKLDFARGHWGSVLVEGTNWEVAGTKGITCVSSPILLALCPNYCTELQTKRVLQTKQQWGHSVV